MMPDIEPIAGFEHVATGLWEAYVELGGTRISIQGPTPIDAMTQLARSLASERFKLVWELATRPPADRRAYPQGERPPRNDERPARTP